MEVEKREEKPAPTVFSSQSPLFCHLHFSFFYCSDYSRYSLFEKRFSTEKRLISLLYKELLQAILKTGKRYKGHKKAAHRKRNIKGQ